MSYDCIEDNVNNNDIYEFKKYLKLRFGGQIPLFKKIDLKIIFDRAVWFNKSVAAPRYTLKFMSKDKKKNLTMFN